MEPRRYWLYAHKLCQTQTNVGILYQDPANCLASPKQTIIRIELARIDAELTTILELLKRIPVGEQIEIQLPYPSITVKLLRRKDYMPTQRQKELIERIETEHQRLCQTRHSISVTESSYRLPFLRLFQDRVRTIEL